MVKSKPTGFIVLGLLVVASLALWWVPKIEVFGWDQLLHPHKISPAFYKRDVFAQEDRARQTLATILGGLAVLAGAYLTWRNVQIAEDKQLTDRFTAAVTNLSADESGKMAQRLGGIYALERIARDSPEDHWTVMEVLTAYVRDKRQKNVGEVRMAAPTDIPADIQATLTVIGRRNIEQDDGRNLDIYRVDLFKAYLAGVNLRGAVMGENFMMQANLIEADLAGAYLAKADLTGADLRRANLWRANLGEANLLNADLAGARMQGADLHECENLTQQQLNSADQELIPASLPPGLTFPGYVDPVPPPDPPPTPPA